MPEWILALQIAMQLEPLVAQAIDLAKLPELTIEQMTTLQASRDAAISKLEADLNQ